MAAPDLSGFLQQESAARNTFADRSAQNTFAKNRTQMGGARALQDLRRGFTRSLPKFGASFGQRGLSGGGIRSGVMARAMNDYVGDYTRQVGRQQQDNFDQLQEYDFNQSRFAAERDQALADIAAAKAATIANTANQISALRPYMGGY
jgi:hypothetical protein